MGAVDQAEKNVSGSSKGQRCSPIAYCMWGGADLVFSQFTSGKMVQVEPTILSLRRELNSLVVKGTGIFLGRFCHPHHLSHNVDPFGPFPRWAQASFSNELQVRKGCPCMRLHKNVNVCPSVLGSNNS